MNRFQTALAAFAALIAMPAFAHDGVHINDPYARVTGKVGASGAVFFEIENHQDVDDRLISAASDAAERVELHTHKDEGGVMKMMEVKEGFAVPALGFHTLARGGDHVMMMGLKSELKNGDVIDLTLTFERAGAVQVQATIDNERKPEDGAMGHEMGGHKMEGDKMGHDTHTANGHHSAAVAVDTAGMADPEAIAAIMKAQFDTPENPLTVDPITIEGDHALASWAQDGKGGRALLERRHGAWVIVLCGGADLRMPAFLAENGVSTADSLSALFNLAEDALGAEKVALYSSFEGVVMISPKE
ncbi:MAG: copper uptake system-associated protein [Cypionkella sp.]|nr:copper uptake system-associated protein [Cypionkella sp.]